LSHGAIFTLERLISLGGVVRISHIPTDDFRLIDRRQFLMQLQHLHSCAMTFAPRFLHLVSSFTQGLPDLTTRIPESLAILFQLGRIIAPDQNILPFLNLSLEFNIGAFHAQHDGQLLRHSFESLQLSLIASL